MKKYILYTNNKMSYHAHELVFEDIQSLEKHLFDVFDFATWNFNDIIGDFKTYIDDSEPSWIFEYTLKDFLKDNFNFLNAMFGMNEDLFEKLYKNEVLILSTFSDTRYSMIVDTFDVYNKTEHLTTAFNELLRKHGSVTSPVGVVNEYEIVIDSDYIEGQEEFDLPF